MHEAYHQTIYTSTQQPGTMVSGLVAERPHERRAEKARIVLFFLHNA
jgi:hypothetical protein